MGADRVARRYRGKGATNYDAKRAYKEKWRLENEGVELLLRFPMDLHDEHERTLLDVPVGTGRFQYLYEREGIKATGIDTSKDMLEEARKKGMAELRKGDIRKLPFPDDSFDVALCMRLFPWFEPQEVAQSLKELARVVRVLIVGIRTNPDRPFCKNGALWNHYHPDFVRWVSEARLKIDADFQCGKKGNAVYRLVRSS